MDTGISPSFDLVERRLSLMHQLAAELELAQKAILARDIELLEAHTGKQAVLCTALQELSTQIHVPAIDPLSETSNFRADRQQWSDLMNELAAAERRVNHLGRVHALLLGKARQTVDIFLRILAAADSTYEVSGSGTRK